MAETLGIAIIGAGMMGEVHTRALRLAGATVCGIVASDKSRATQAAARLGIGRSYAPCFEAFVADTYAVIRGETREGLPTFEDGWRSACIVDAVLASSKANGWVRIE